MTEEPTTGDVALIFIGLIFVGIAWAGLVAWLTRHGND